LACEWGCFSFSCLCFENCCLRKLCRPRIPFALNAVDPLEFFSPQGPIYCAPSHGPSAAGFFVFEGSSFGRAVIGIKGQGPSFERSAESDCAAGGAVPKDGERDPVCAVTEASALPAAV